MQCEVEVGVADTVEDEEATDLEGDEMRSHVTKATNYTLNVAHGSGLHADKPYILLGYVCLHESKQCGVERKGEGQESEYTNQMIYTQGWEAG